MNLESQSWEYASEMVLKSVHLELRTGEVPVRFLKDPEGRVSHHRRQGWFSPFAAAWINLRAMFVYGADFFVFGPGCVLLALGLLLMLPVTFGPVTIGPVTFSLTSQFIGAMLAVVGLQGVFLGCLAKIFFDYTGRRTGRHHAVVPLHARRVRVVRHLRRSASGCSSHSSSATSRTTWRFPSSRSPTTSPSPGCS